MEYIVYVKTDANGHITAVNSSEFLTDTSGWTEIDRGRGDKYHHAQGNYFPLPVVTEGGAYRYKLTDGVPVECSAEEIAVQEQEAANQPDTDLTGSAVWDELDAAYQEGVDSV